MDPCCGSGHFLVAAFEMLRRMRMEEEGLSEAAAADAVLRDNLHGLELDPRCTQIAAFALALAAWKAGGYRRLPPLNIACSGIGVGGRVEDWTRLAGEDERLKAMLEHLYTLFRDAPTLGSLINPADVPLQLRLFNADYAEVEPLLQRALAKTRDIDDPTAEVFGAAAEGAAKAAALLARTYTLVATNVPYLTRSKQDEALRGYCDQHYFDTKADLATAFIDRCRAFTVPGGSYALVTPQNWLFLGAYSKMRTRLLKEQRWKHISRLGPSAFETISGEVVKAALVILTNRSPSREQALTGIDVSNTTTASGKASGLRQLPLQASTQTDQLHNPDARISLHESAWTALLSTYATCYQGIKTGDDARFRRCFWEFDRIPTTWRLYESTVENTTLYSGREYIVDWRQRGDNIARRQGMAAWGKRGLAVSQMGALAATLYCGDAFDSNAGAIIPKNPLHLAAIWAFCKSPEFSKAVRRIDTALKVTNASLVKVPFDLEQWQAVADAAGPLPEPHSDDPTQWLFEGRPVGATEPLQVAVARLLGYHWPRQGRDDLDAFADADGIVCLPPVAGEPPAAERLRALLAAAYGDEWSTAQAERLLSAAGFGGKGLQAWLRDGFFARHCRLFHNRPFIWQVWDGRNDGFSALVNYHKLDAACLDRLIYTYLGAWIAVQRAALSAEVKPDEAADAEGRLVAALALRKKLEAIRDGEPPYDIYVRWKPLHAQPIGWRPDLNDGVRLNVRPFVAAKALRSAFTVSWNKDRGANPDGSERLNDPHYTRAEKQAAREAAGLSE